MKKFSLALVAAAMALAISTSAWATPACTGLVTNTTVCSEGNFTFTFELVSLIPPGTAPVGVYFGAPPATNGSGNSANLDFQIDDQLPADAHLIYEVTGTPGPTTIDNSFIGNGSITEVACSVDPTLYEDSCPALDVLVTNPSSANGAEQISSVFTSTGSFWISKDADGASPNAFSEFDDSVQVTPEPSSLMLFGTGLLGLAFVAFRKSKASGTVLGM